MSEEEILGLAEFGLEAARASDIDRLLSLACAEASGGLAVSHAKILLYLPEDKELLVRAGTGWPSDVVGKARLRADLGSPAGYALQTGEPTIANDLATENRFRVPELLSENGVRSAVNVLIRYKDFIYGVLEADSREPREFDERDVRFLQGYANILAMTIVCNMEAERNAKLSKELETLYRELAHRTRNNNQMLLSMLRLKKKNQTMLETREVIDDIASRIVVLSDIDSVVNSTVSDGHVDLGRYVISIASNIFAVNAEKSASVKLITEVSEVSIPTSRAQTIGLIVNEFVTNSFQHAFREGDKGEMRIALRVDGQGQAILELADNGPGLPIKRKEGFGLKLIESMSAALGAKTSWSRKKGTILRLILEPRKLNET